MAKDKDKKPQVMASEKVADRMAYLKKKGIPQNLTKGKMPKETLEQVQRRLEKKKAALAYKLKITGEGPGKLSAREEATLRRAKRANLKETRSGKRVRPGLGDLTSKTKDPYANPNE